jgi:hypothetical protein
MPSGGSGTGTNPDTFWLTVSKRRTRLAVTQAKYNVLSSEAAIMAVGDSGRDWATASQIIACLSNPETRLTTKKNLGVLTENSFISVKEYKTGLSFKQGKKP